MGSAENVLTTDRDEFWLFGYGSLIWKPPPHFDRRIPGWVTGYVRRFWQASQDHRGTPEAPGRVVTLLERDYWASLTDHHDHAPDRVWGVAYRIRPDRVAEVKDYLDIREINGYTIHYTAFHPAPPTTASLSDSPPDELPRAYHDGAAIQTLVYIGTPDNDQFTGPQDPQALAAHIYKSVGPSGRNIDYLFNLHEALEQLSPESGDEHIRDLAERVQAIIAAEESRGHDPQSELPETSGEFQKNASTEEQEETEKDAPGS
ncbi:ChaC-domain-containing protein [Sodiomyces alkalinus F11]|uniref:glutathione-specific gamma-glutamylcyclotransferase n=1 Tax=Sodiomyces alkalinus (strain CBS 110278 / VKM F-3762 / F11) TaxID=1314773 RepID=A0A3N2PZT1_SODAK|nr:ChaC-domain-containing protein [Sodiomyces alkalinus F11]ROT39865.1 ChaC-domain-containing protein [Sodiomyces alkalinus F11]